MKNEESLSWAWPIGFAVFSCVVLRGTVEGIAFLAAVAAVICLLVKLAENERLKRILSLAVACVVVLGVVASLGSFLLQLARREEDAVVILAFYAAAGAFFVVFFWLPEAIGRAVTSLRAKGTSK